MQNRWVFIIPVVVFLGLLVTSKYLIEPDTKKIEIDSRTSQPIELTFWRNRGNDAENRAYEELVSSFEKENQDIKINMKMIPYSDYEVRLRTEMATGTPPDIMAIDSPNLALYANAGSLLSIDSYMKKEGDLADFPASTMKGLTYKGQIYLAPIAESSIALFYNKHVLKKAGVPFPSSDPNKPLSWNQVVKIAKLVTNHEKGITGIDPGQGFGDGEAPAYFKIPLLWQFGADVVDQNSTTASGYLDSEKAIMALQFYQDLYHKHQVASVEIAPDAFVKGKLGMTILGSWSLKGFEKISNFTLDNDFGVAPLPKGVSQVAPNGGWALGISSKTKYPDESWRFIKYVTSYEGIKTYVTITGDLPARYSVVKDIPELKQYPLNIFIEQMLNHSKNRPVTPAYPIVSNTIRTLFEDIGIGGKDVRSSAKVAAEKINTGLQEFQKP
ncbi:ABC transporter substrate-binding protein [Bacillus sp. FJAT-18017]|uniref:ABC transporter substrate-binding protein n=1 Tax=Bacillus sp. FJAT-18017 TaxID=1705566 RepID=UPI0009EC0B72|nr:sugar ABC transporter substrate-binding protein [Bacillus sp. FJAT-18017]